MITLTPQGAPPLVCTRARVQWPSYGLWWADVDAPEHAPAPRGTACALEIAGSVFMGSIASGGVHDARTSYRIVAGRGGWSAALSRRGYMNDLGVSADTLVQDLAQAAGEPPPIGSAALARRGSHYTRQAQTASATLHELMPRAWYTTAAGVVVCSSPAASVFEGIEWTETAYDVRANVTRLAGVESIVGLVPGARYKDREPACDVEITCSADGLEATLWHAAVPMPRRLRALAEIVDRLDPRRAYRAAYEYRIVGQEGERLNLQPVRTASGMSDLVRVPVRPGMAGLKAEHAIGSLCMVAFADADPSRPFVFAFDDADSPGWAPVHVYADASSMVTVAGGAAPVTRDDHLQAALAAIDTAIQAGFAGIGAGLSANGALGGTAYSESLGAWPPATAADKLETD